MKTQQAHHPVWQGASAPTRPPFFQRKSTWLGIAAVIVVAICGMAFGAGDPPKTVDPITEATAGLAPQQAQSVVVEGNGNSVVPINATLNGAFIVDYTADYNALIIAFLKADGGDGASWEDIGINEFSMDPGLSGQVVMHLENVTMIQASNTEGHWALKLTPLG